MMKFVQSNAVANQAKSLALSMGSALFFVSALMLPGIAFADTPVGGDLTNTGKTVCGFFTNINGLLNMASIAVVTIAVIFSGYQIAFNNKRIGEVSTILIGGVLIGAAGQIARMLIGGDGDACGSVGAEAAGFVTLIPWAALI